MNNKFYCGIDVSKKKLDVVKTKNKQIWESQSKKHVVHGSTRRHSA